MMITTLHPKIKKGWPSENIQEAKRLIKVLEQKTGKRVSILKEEENLVTGPENLDGIIYKLQFILSFIEYQGPIIIEKINKNNDPAGYFKAFSKQLMERLGIVLQELSTSPPEEISEDLNYNNTGKVDMDIDTAIKDPQDLKKLTDKKINVNLTDDDNNTIISTI